VKKVDSTRGAGEEKKSPGNEYEACSYNERKGLRVISGQSSVG